MSENDSRPDQAPLMPDLDTDVEREVAEVIGDSSVEQLMQQAEAVTTPPVEPGDVVDDDAAGKSSAGDDDENVGFEIRRGKIRRVTGEDVFVDLVGIDSKMQGLVPLKQFERPPRQGSIMDFVVERIDEAEGLVHLSREGAVSVAAWDRLTKGQTIEARVMSTNKGGLDLEMGGAIKAFMPASQVEIGHTEDLDQFVGMKLTAMVQEVDRRAKRVIISRRKHLEHERERQRQRLLKQLEEGQSREGTVSRIMPFGAFVDLGGLDGLLHISDLSYARVNNPEEVVKVGQAVTVMVLKIEEDGQKIRLGLKQIQPDPWEGAAGQYHEGEDLTARVVRLTNFGAFVELEPGIEGLVPISELSWKRISRPSSVCKEGDTVRLKVMQVDAEKRRISLSLKQAQGDPWADVEQKYPKRQVVTGTVVRTTPFGAFVELETGVEGLAHISELADHRVNTVEDVVEVGQTHEFRVLDIDIEQRKIGLSIKAVKVPPPEESAEQAAAQASSKPTAKKRAKKDLKSGLGDHGGMGLGLGNLKL